MDSLADPFARDEPDVDDRVVTPNRAGATGQERGDLTEKRTSRVARPRPIRNAPVPECDDFALRAKESRGTELALDNSAHDWFHKPSGARQAQLGRGERALGLPEGLPRSLGVHVHRGVKVTECEYTSVAITHSANPISGSGGGVEPHRAAKAEWLGARRKE